MMRMYKILILLLGVYFHSLTILADEKSSISDKQSVNSPEIQQLYKTVRENLKKQEIYWRNQDFSKYTTEELFDFIPPGSTSISSILAGEELEKRPEEVRIILENKLKRPRHSFDSLNQLPYLAGMVSTDYQVEVTKRCLFREEMKQADMMLRIQEDVDGYGIFSIIAQSKQDETAVLDQLIAEGRLERGSDFELKWRKRLSGAKREEKKQSGRMGIQSIPVQSLDKVESLENSFNSDSWLNFRFLTLMCFGALLGLIFLFFKILGRN